MRYFQWYVEFARSQVRVQAGQFRVDVFGVGGCAENGGQEFPDRRDRVLVDVRLLGFGERGNLVERKTH
jgi:hypothetical protein